MARLRLYIVNVLLSVDMLCCSLLGGFRGETISGRLGRYQARGEQPWAFLAALLDVVVLRLFGESGHCANAAVNDTEFWTQEALPIR